MRTTTRTTALLIALLVMMALSVTPASAHAVLLDSDPADGAELDTLLEQVTLTFNEPIEAGLAQIHVEGPDGTRIDAGVAEPAADGNGVATDIAIAQAGSHLIAFQVVSDDGHPIEGELTFTVSEVAVVTEEPDEPEEPDTGATDGAGDQADEADPSDGASETDDDAGAATDDTDPGTDDEDPDTATTADETADAADAVTTDAATSDSGISGTTIAIAVIALIALAVGVVVARGRGGDPAS